MGFRRSLVRIQSPRHHKVRQAFKFWRTFPFPLETALQETLQKTQHMWAIFGEPDAYLFLLAMLLLSAIHNA
jgi:hypothetical protein